MPSTLKRRQRVGGTATDLATEPGSVARALASRLPGGVAAWLVSDPARPTNNNSRGLAGSETSHDMCKASGKRGRVEAGHTCTNQIRDQTARPNKDQVRIQDKGQGRGGGDQAAVT